MTQPWWGKEAQPNPRVSIVRNPVSSSGQPELQTSTRSATVEAIRSRIPAYTPEWTNYRSTDAGRALLQLFSEQIEPTWQRLNLLPRKALIEFLSISGVTNLPATPAEAQLEFSVSDGATESILVPRGFQVSAPPATGQGDPVIFETEFDLYAAPAKIEKLYVQESSSFLELDVKSTAPFLPFGDNPIPGRALLVGLSGAAPSHDISFGIGIADVAGVPPPVPAGGIEPVTSTFAPLLAWEVLDGASYVPLEVTRDETGGFFRSGIIELVLPRRWRQGRPEGLEDKEDQQLRWLRLRIVFGEYDPSPRFSYLKLNVTRALAARTIRDEILEPVADSQGRQLRVSQTPVIPNSLVLEVDDGAFNSPIQNEIDQLNQTSTSNQQTVDATASTFGRQWSEVESLLLSGSEAEVYSLDSESGIVTFGDGVHGKQLPQGFRNVRAASYRVGGGTAGAVPADSITTMLSSAPFINAVTNPLPASGGTDRETQIDAVRRGPQEFRARGRAVTVADYALMAMRTPGAQVARAFGVSGFHPLLPGRPIPGVVGVFVVPPDRGEGPPTPDQDTLRAVASNLSEKLAPLGAEIVVAAPRYQRIRAIANIVADPTDVSGTIRRLLSELNTYLHPLTGGDDGQGWPFGGRLQYSVLVRRLLARVSGLLAISTLNFELDGLRILRCQDVPAAPYALFWPENHDVVVQQSEGPV